MYFQDASILGHDEHPHQRSADFFEDFCDGTYFKDHPFFNPDPQTFQIIPCYYTSEVCNPLGHCTKKMAIVLFMVSNIPPKYQSNLKLHCMSLVASAAHPVVEK